LATLFSIRSANKFIYLYDAWNQVNSILDWKLLLCSTANFSTTKRPFFHPKAVLAAEKVVSSSKWVFSFLSFLQLFIIFKSILPSLLQLTTPLGWRRRSCSLRSSFCSSSCSFVPFSFIVFVFRSICIFLYVFCLSVCLNLLFSHLFVRFCHPFSSFRVSFLGLL